jgi:TolB-like protein/Flp pilus assembly protein TadD
MLDVRECAGIGLRLEGRAGATSEQTMSGLFAELKRRNVLRAGAFYGALAWLLVQVATQVFPFFDVPNWAVRWTVIAVAIGFPFVLTFSWFYEFTPRGLQLESDLDAADPVAHRSHRKFDRWIIAILGIAVILLLADQILLHRDAARVSRPPAATSTAPVAANSVAVMPLTDENGDQGEQYFSDGLSEDLITTLSQFDGLKVISRDSSFRFRDSKDDAKTIGVKLGVSHLLEGSVRHVGDAVRISASLVNAADGTTLWSQRYDRKYKDLLVLQDEVANAVATALTTKLLDQGSEEGSVVTQSDRPPSGNLDAYQNMLQGKFYRMRGDEADLHKAVAFYDEAIRFDPRYARAYTGLSLAWVSLGVVLAGDKVQQAFENARAAVASALSLDPNLASAHVARGRLLEITDFDLAGAEAEYRRALQLAPHDGDAKYFLALMAGTIGRTEEAVEQLRQSLVVDPLSARTYDRLSRYLTALGRLDEAEQASRTAIEMQPAAGFYGVQLTVIEVLRGDAPAALRVAQKILPGTWQEVALALARQIGGDHASADAALKKLVDTGAGDGAYQIAEVYALRKQPDQAFKWLDRALENRDPGILMLLTDPFLLAYKDDPRFAAFCEKVSLPLPGDRGQVAHNAK